MKDWQDTGLAGVNICGSPVGSCNHIHWRGLCCGLRGLLRMCGAVYFGNASEIWSLKVVFFCCSELSERAAAFERLLAFPPPITSSGCFAFWGTGKGLWWSERGQKERRNKVNNSTQTVYGRCWGKRVISAGLPLSASCFSALFIRASPPTPSPSCHSSTPQSLFPFLSLFFSSLHLSTHFYLLFLFPPLLFSLIEISLMHFPSGFLLGYFVLFLSVPWSPFLSLPLVPG